jgi:hypothetical protein
MSTPKTNLYVTVYEKDGGPMPGGFVASRLSDPKNQRGFLRLDAHVEVELLATVLDSLGYRVHFTDTPSASGGYFPSKDRSELVRDEVWAERQSDRPCLTCGHDGYLHDDGAGPCGREKCRCQQFLEVVK